MKPVYETDDGERFSTRKAADAHQRIVMAERAWREACRVLGEALLGQATTADGSTIDLTESRTFYWIRPSHVGLPTLAELWFNRWNMTYENRSGLVITQQDSEGRYRTYRVSELYADKAKADAALLVAQRERLAEWTAQVEKGSE